MTKPSLNRRGFLAALGAAVAAPLVPKPSHCVGVIRPSVPVASAPTSWRPADTMRVAADMITCRVGDVITFTGRWGQPYTSTYQITADVTADGHRG